jgi:hypothetical protein
MTKRTVPSMPLATILALALVAGVVQAGPDSTRTAVPSGDGAVARPGVRMGNLFSAVTFADSAFGREWAGLRDEAQERFPDLELTQVADLHVTVVYIGGGWKPEDLDGIRARALVVPAAPVRLTPEVVRLGRNDQVVAIELHPATAAWADSVTAAKDALNRLGLKKPDRYDSDFRAHVTMAQAAHNPPTPADSTALAGFRAWLEAKVAAAPQEFAVAVGPTTRVLLLLAGATRPDGAPEYVTVEDFLARRPAVK